EEEDPPRPAVVDAGQPEHPGERGDVLVARVLEGAARVRDRAEVVRLYLLARRRGLDVLDDHRLAAGGVRRRVHAEAGRAVVAVRLLERGDVRAANARDVGERPE